MQTTIFSLIDLLTNMSGTTNSYESLQEKIEKIDQDIPQLKEELDELKSSITPDKYFDATSEIVDRNIEISVSKKIAALEKELLGYQKELKVYNKEQNKLYETIDSLKQKIIKAKGSFNIIESRNENTNQVDSKRFYEDLAKFSISKIEEYQKELKEKEAICEENEVKINELSQIIASINSKLDKYRTRLEEVRVSLSNKSYYINEELKQKDKDAIEEIKNKISDLEKEKELYLNDPTILASEIKGLFASNNANEALDKLNNLIKIIKEKPYMDVNDVHALEIELENLETQQAEQTALIENKKYMGSNIDFLNDRIDYINILINDKESQISAIEAKINNIDTYLVENASKRLRMAENEATKLSEAISNYYDLIKSNDQASVVTLNNLKMSHDKKCNELKVINDLIQKYELELTNLIRKSNKLENEDLVRYHKQIEDYKKEINDINNLISTSSKTKDIIEQENDKKKLREIIENIKLIKKRLSFKKSADEIYDEIEMWISSESTEEFDAVKEYQDDSILKEEEVYNDIDLTEETNKPLNEEDSNDEVKDAIEYKFPVIEEDEEPIEEPNSEIKEDSYIDVEDYKVDLPLSEKTTYDDSNLSVDDMDEINEKMKSLYGVEENENSNDIFSEEEPPSINLDENNEYEEKQDDISISNNSYLDNTVNFKNSFFEPTIEEQNEEQPETDESKLDNTSYLNNTVNFKNSFFEPITDEPVEEKEELESEPYVPFEEVDLPVIEETPIEEPQINTVDISTLNDLQPTEEDSENEVDDYIKENPTNEYSFSELEDTGYFNLDDFLKNIETNE